MPTVVNPTKANWTDPTTNADGSPIAAGEITGYLLGVRDTTVAGSAAGTYPYSIQAPATSTSQLLSAITPTLPTGKVLAAAVQALTANNASAWSAEAQFELEPVPSAPTGFGVA
jgi:hypothetical protein